MNKRVLIIGDVMTDRYVWGEVRRISPEAPVPVLRGTSEKIFPGGAANVAHCISHITRETCVLATGNISVDFGQHDGEHNPKVKYKILASQSGKFIEKVRYLSGSNHILRLDWDYDCVPADVSVFLKEVGAEAKNSDYVVISDYNKGTIFNAGRIISEVNASKRRIYLDPKNWSKGKYQNIFMIKPNLSELEEYAGHQIDPNDITLLSTICATICCDENINYVLVTLNKYGSIIFDADGLVSQQIAPKIEVFDVTGAGDTFIAAFAYMYEETGDISRSHAFASEMSIKTVSKIGSYHLNVTDVSEHAVERGKYQSNEQTRTVVANGCFDILHAGHLNLLHEASKLGDRLIVLIDSDHSVRKLKGDSRPINSEYERIEALEALPFVDEVKIFESHKLLDELSKLKPTFLVKGGDYKAEDVIGYDLLNSYGGSIKIIPYLEGHSTTQIIEKIRNK